MWLSSNAASNGTEMAYARWRLPRLAVRHGCHEGRDPLHHEAALPVDRHEVVAVIQDHRLDEAAETPLQMEGVRKSCNIVLPGVNNQRWLLDLRKLRHELANHRNEFAHASSGGGGEPGLARVAVEHCPCNGPPDALVL